MKELKKIRSEAQKVLKNNKSSLLEKQQAQIILNLDSALIISMAQRNNWLDAFANKVNIKLSEARKTLKEEDSLIKKFLKRK